MKKIIGMVFLALFLVCKPVYGAEPESVEDYYAAVEEGRWVYDFAEILSEDTKEELEEQISSIRDQIQMDIVILTADQMFHYDQKDLADNFYDRGCFGYEESLEHGSGILLLIDIERRQLYISTAGLGIVYFHEVVWNIILDDIIDEASEGDFDRVSTEFVEDVAYYGNMAVSTETYQEIADCWYSGVNQGIADKWYNKAYKDYSEFYVAYEELIDSVLDINYDYNPGGIITKDKKDLLSLNYEGYHRKTFFTLFRNPFVDLAIGLAVAGVAVFALRNAKGKNAVADRAVYRSSTSISLREKEDHFLRRSTVAVKIEKNSDHGGGGAGGNFHTSSGGVSHGGVGRGF